MSSVGAINTGSGAVLTHGYLAGAFDLLNVGDLDAIRQALERCDQLVVGVYTDQYAEKISGRLPVVPFDERSELVRHVRGVADIAAHDELTDWYALAENFSLLATRDHSFSDLAEHIAPVRRTASPQLLTALASTVETTGLERGVA